MLPYLRQKLKEHEYHKFLESIQKTFYINIKLFGYQLFTTNVDKKDLWNIFLYNIPEEYRQYYNCHSCKEFIQKYGGLIFISNAGIKYTFWNIQRTPEFFKFPVFEMNNFIKESNVSGLFFTEQHHLGKLGHGNIQHMKIILPAIMVHIDKTETARQKMIRKRKDFNKLKFAIDYYNDYNFEDLLTFLIAEKQFHTENMKKRIEFFKEIHKLKYRIDKTYQINKIWRLVADYPSDYCNIKKSFFASVLNDLKKEKDDYNIIMMRFKKKLLNSNYILKSTGLVGQICQ
jgi:hypothetical protein